MMRFIKLVNFEVSRFLLLFSIMMGVIVGTQITAAIINANFYLDRVHKVMRNDKLTYEQYAKEFGEYNLTQALGGLGFIGPLLFGIAVLVLYVFFIWYRDWFGKATFSYRLLMLPTNRLNIYFAKLVTLLLFIFTALAVELGVLYSIFIIFEDMIPSEIYSTIRFQEIGMNDIFYLILPYSFGLFSFNYLLGIAAVMVVFTCILFERSYRLKGVMYAVLFAVLCVAIALAPVIYQDVTSMLFLTEMYTIETIVAILICTLSIITSNYLLKHKINV